MDTLPLPGSSLLVPKMTLGCEPLGGTDWGPLDWKEVGNAIAWARDHGITMFDTADVYGLGLSEERLAEVLGSSRHDLTIMTKGGVRWDTPVDGRAKTRIDISPSYLKSALEASLRRLRLDRIPVYLIYAPTSADMPIPPAMETLEKLRQDGKILHYGLSNFSATQLETATRYGAPTFLQARHSLIDRAHEFDLFPAAIRQGIMITTYGSLAQGLLSGKFSTTSTFERTDRRHRLPHFSPEQMPAHLALVERLKTLAARYQRTPAQIALAWASSKKGITSLVVGAKSIRQVAENSEAFAVALTFEDQQFLEG
jgi:aryl-alcohol dehydrogenase-like predicted oxidoreductase